MIDLGLKYHGDKIPETVIETERGQRMVYIPYDVTEDNGHYSWTYIRINQFKYNYGELINHLIGMKYSLQETLAILNNYIADPNNKDYKAEFDDLQKCRKEAKDFARKHFNM